MDHTDLFSVLCKCVNLETHKVEGRVRSYCSQPSPQLCCARPSSWSALLLPGGWGLVDCVLGARLWASRQTATTHHHHNNHTPGNNNLQTAPQQSRTQSRAVSVNGEPEAAGCGNDNSRSSHYSSSGMSSGKSRSGNRSTASSAVESFRAGREFFSPHNFYFLPPPQLLVASHLPDSPCWQLLPHPVAETDFHTSLLTKPHLHYLGVELVSPTSLRLTEISEEMDVTWTLKGEGLRRFAFRLFSVGDGGSARQEVTRHGFLENRHSQGAVSLRLIPPTSGRYVCELYGTYVPARGNEMIHMCSFDLDFVKTTSTPLKFPHNDRVEWGPGAECVALGLTPATHATGCVNVDKGEAELVFSFSRPLLITQKLFSAADEGQGTEIPHSTVNFRDSKNRIKILLRIPDPGDYVLSIYAKEDSSPGKCQLVCSYLVLCDSGTPEVVHPFPSLPFNKLGPTKAFSDLHMKLVCPKRSCIVVAPYSGKVTFVFNSPDEDAAELSCDLVHHQGHGGEEVTDSGDYVQHTCQSGESVFRARLSLAGNYLFHLYGRPWQGEGHKFLLYSALIECAVPNKDCLPLPRVVPEWRSRVQILAPLRKFLVAEAVTHFAVRAYKVKGVAVVGQSGVQHFVNEDEEEDEGKDGDDDDDDDGGVGGGEGNAHITEVTETKAIDKKVDLHQPDERVEQFRKDEDAASPNTANGSSATRAESGETDEVNEKRDNKGHPDGDADAAAVAPKDSASHTAHAAGHLEHHASSAARRVTMKQDEDDDDDDDDDGYEREDDWEVWQCKVKVNREDEGSGVKLCVQTQSSSDSHLVCVTEFQVITERTMAVKLDHQHSLWAAAEEHFKVRPDSGHRSDIDDEERQSAYFLDDEVYLSNPLGDENSDSDDSDNFSGEDDDVIADDVSTADEEDIVSDLEDTATVTNGSSTAKKQDRSTAGVQDSRTTRQNVAGTGGGGVQRKPDRGVPATKKMNVVPSRKAKNERCGGQTKRTYHASAVYNAPQPFSNNRESRQHKAALMQKAEKKAHSSQARRGEKKKRPSEQEQKTKEKAEEKSHPSGPTEREKFSEAGTGSLKNKKGKNADGSTVDQDSGTRERALRRKLWKACQCREREAIRKAVRHYTKGGYPPCPDLTAAERLLHLFKLQDALSEALGSGDTDSIRHALREVERHGYAGEMSLDCRKAHALLSPHRHPPHGRLPGTLLIQQLQPQTDLRTLREIRSYRCPPRLVHNVIVATLLLLGVHEGQSKTWKRCLQRLQVLGRQGILKKMAKVREDTVHPEISARARQLLDKHTTEEAQNAGPGLLVIFRWANKVLFRAENLAELDEAYTGDGRNAPPQPASKRRQREIFRQQQTTTSSDASTTTSATATTSTTTTNTSSTNHSSTGKEVQKAKSGKHTGVETPRNKPRTARDSSKDPKERQKKGATSDRDRSSRKLENADVSKQSTNQQQDKDGAEKVAGRQNGQTDAKKTHQPAGPAKPANNPAWESDSSQATINTNSNNSLKSKPTQNSTPTKTMTKIQHLSDEPKTQSPGHLPRPKPPPPQKDNDGPEKNSSNAPAAVSQHTPSPHTGGRSSQRTSAIPKGSPERSTAKPSTVPHKQSEEVRRPQQPATSASSVRYNEEPREQLHCLSPHKSPLFRPAANKTRNKADAVRPRPSNRPKTTPTPVLQSTFFFASLVGKEKDEDEEVNNNIPLTFKNFSNGGSSRVSCKTTRSAGADDSSSRAESRLGQRGGVGGPQRQTQASSGRRRITADITTPDI